MYPYDNSKRKYDGGAVNEQQHSKRRRKGTLYNKNVMNSLEEL